MEKISKGVLPPLRVNRRPLSPRRGALQQSSYQSTRMPLEPQLPSNERSPRILSKTEDRTKQKPVEPQSPSKGRSPRIPSKTEDGVQIELTTSSRLPILQPVTQHDKQTERRSSIIIEGQEEAIKRCNNLIIVEGELQTLILNLNEFLSIDNKSSNASFKEKNRKEHLKGEIRRSMFIKGDDDKNLNPFTSLRKFECLNKDQKRQVNQILTTLQP